MMNTSPTDKAQMSADDVLAAMDATAREFRYCGQFADASTINDIRTAVAALIARNAEIEAQALSVAGTLAENSGILRKANAGLVELIDERDALRDALSKISDLDPADTSDGFNEWGEAWCFNAAQRVANDALAPALARSAAGELGNV